MATKMLRLESADFFRGLFVAAFSAGLTALQQLFGTDVPINWKAIGGVALAAGVAYILKNLVTNQHDEVLGVAATAPADAPPAKE